MSNEEIILPTPTDAASRAVTRCDGLAGGPLHHVQSVRNDSSFVAQLIATADNMPQTRHRRRAEPREALAAYSLPRSPAPAASQTRRVA